MTDLAIAERVSDPRPGAEALVSRNSAVLNDVHGYVLDHLNRLEARIAELKLSIEEAKNRAQVQTTIYVEMVDDSLRTTQNLEAIINKIERQVRKM